MEKVDVGRTKMNRGEQGRTERTRKNKVAPISTRWDKEEQSGDQW